MIYWNDTFLCGGGCVGCMWGWGTYIVTKIYKFSPRSFSTGFSGTSLLTATVVLLDPAIGINGKPNVCPAFALWVDRNQHEAAKKFTPCMKVGIQFRVSTLI